MLRFLEHRVFAARGPIVPKPIAANRQPAVALHERHGAAQIALSIQVLRASGGRIREITGFVGDDLFPAFGLPSVR